MKEITFRPLRRIKKSGKICVAPYMQWRKVKTADYSECNLTIECDYKKYALTDYVYNHKGEQLFWFNNADPDTLTKETVKKRRIDILELIELLGEEFEGESWRFAEVNTNGFHHSIHGFDCDGVPVFNHHTADYVATHWTDVTQFEPLTVGTVVKWFGFFLYQLKKSTLTFK